MKRFAILALALMLTFALCACRMGSNDQPTDPTPAPTAAPTTVPTTTPTVPTDPTMPGGSDFMDPSYETVAPNGGTPVG